MGLQVGHTCYADEELAKNVYFSQVPPVITVDGKLQQLQSINGKWYLNSVEVKANLPFCDPVANYKQGYEMVGLLLPTAVVLFGAKLIVDMFKDWLKD